MRELGSIRSYTRRGHTYYVIRLTLKGVRYSVYNHKGVTFTSRSHAEAVLAQIRGKLAEASNSVRALAEFLPRASKPDLVLEVMREYLGELEEKVRQGELSPHSVGSLRRWIEPPEKHRRRRAGTDHYRWFTGVSLHELSARKIRAFKTHLKDQGVRSQTMRTVLERLKAFLQWCHAQDEPLIDRVPAIELPPPVKRRPKILSDSQRARVLAEIPGEIRGIFFLLCLGVRPGAARAVEVQDIDQGFIRIHRAVKGHGCDAPVGPTKARKENWVPLTRELDAWVKEYARDRHPSARLFWNPKSPDPGRRWNHRAIWLEWRRASGAAGVPYVPLYQGTKHSFATGRLMAGRSKEALAEFMQISRGQVDTYAQWARELSAQVLEDGELAEETKARVIELRGGTLGEQPRGPKR